MIKQFCFKNFKNFDDTHLNIEELTTLIGTNSAGKSNAIEGIKILNQLASGLEISLVLEGTNSLIGSVRGGAEGCCQDQFTSFTLGCRMQYQESCDLYYEITIHAKDVVYIIDEKLEKISLHNSKRTTCFKTVPCSGTNSILNTEIYNEGKKIAAFGAKVENAILYQTNMFIPTIQKEANQCFDYTIRHLKQIFFFEFLPSNMRNYSRINEIEMKYDGSNLPSVLKHICMTDITRGYFLDVLSKLPDNEIKELHFSTTSLGDVMFTLTESYGNKKREIDARRLSDGTLRCLAILALLMNAGERSLMVIEEVDNGVHPGRIHELINQMSVLAKRKNNSILITTHNAMLLNSYKNNDFDGVSIVYRDKENGYSRFIPFIEIDDFPLLLAKGGLGDVVMSGELSMSIKKKQGEQKDHFEWMEI